MKQNRVGLGVGVSNTCPPLPQGRRAVLAYNRSVPSPLANPRHSLHNLPCLHRLPWRPKARGVGRAQGHLPTRSVQPRRTANTNSHVHVPPTCQPRPRALSRPRGATLNHDPGTAQAIPDAGLPSPRRLAVWCPAGLSLSGLFVFA